MNIAKVLVMAAVLLSVAPGLCFSDTQMDVLARARQQVEQKAYDQALELYSQVKDLLRRDPGLLIEWARVFSYANRHAQAIALFEEVRRDHPEREKEIVRELADQYKWGGNPKAAIGCYQQALVYIQSDFEVELALSQAYAWAGQRREAVMAYDELLAREPGLKKALLGKAEVLSWDDQLEAADALYAKVLANDPRDLTAVNARARIAVWQGYYRKGITLYEQVLQDAPGDPDATEGLAFAYHWKGDGIRALKTLDGLLARYPQRNAARHLYDQIKDMESLRLSHSDRYSYDSNKLSVFSSTQRAAQRLGNGLDMGGSYARQILRQDGKLPIAGDRAGVDISRSINEYLEANSYLYFTKYDFKGYTPFTTNTWLTLRPSDILRFDAGYDRETFEDITALRNNIIVDSGSVSVDLKPDRYWLYSAKYKHGEYSDGNAQDSYLGKVEYRLNHEPYVKLYYNYYYSEWNKRLDNGYFNPDTVSSNVLGVYSSKDLTERLFVEGQMSYGYEVQRPKSDHPVYFGALGLSYRLGRHWMALLRGEYFNAHDTNPGKKYYKRTAWLGLTYSFGRAAADAYQGTQPQRPSGR